MNELTHPPMKTQASGLKMIVRFVLLAFALSAPLAAQSYTISFNANGATSGTAPANATKVNGVAYTLPGNTGNLAKTGYRFAGWSWSNLASRTNHSPGYSHTRDAGMTLYAIWIPNARPSYTVTYNGNGATGGTVPPAQTKELTVDQAAAPNSGNLAKTGFFFEGWNTRADGAGLSYVAGDRFPIEGNSTLYAKWRPVPVVSYNANGATGGTAPANQLKTMDVFLTLATNSGNLVKAGHTFVGWNTAADGTGYNYPVGSSYTTDAPLALFAKWTTAATRTVTYVRGDATSGTPPPAQTQVTTQGMPLALNTGNLSKSGAIFMYWHEVGTSNLYPGDNMHVAGSLYTKTRNITLEPRWMTDPGRFKNVYLWAYRPGIAASGHAPHPTFNVDPVQPGVPTNYRNLAFPGKTFRGWVLSPEGPENYTDPTSGAPVEYQFPNPYVTVMSNYDLSRTQANPTWLYPKFSARNYTISFDINGADFGNTPYAQSKVEGLPCAIQAPNPQTLMKSGFYFAGWNTAANGSGTDYPIGKLYTTDANLSLYAKWVPIGNTATYLVIYNRNTATSGTNPATQIKTFGVPLTLDGNSGRLAKPGFTFAGWNTNFNGTGTDYAAGGSYTADAPVTLYAKWVSASAVTYPVTYNANGATSGTAPAAQTKTQGISLALASNTGNLARTGYTFAGWNTAANGSGTNYAAGASYTANVALTLYAKWTAVAPSTYPVTYNANGATSGTAPAAQTKTQGISLALASNTGNLARTGYTFAGWNTAANGSGTNYAAGASYTANAALTLYANWTAVAPNTYPVTYNANGATGGTAPAAQTKTQGISLVLASNTGNLARTGYTFAGWNTAANGSGTNYAAGASYTANAALTLYANWTAVAPSTYPVTYNANGATGGTAPAAQTKTQGVALTLAGNSGNLVRTGFTFAGWNTVANGSGTSYASGASYTGNAALVLYAQWVVATYAVVYDSNGATGGTIPSAQIKTYNVTLALATNSGGLAKTGHTFGGWNTAANGSGTSYAPGSAYTGNAALTLYARWVINTYPVSYNANGADTGTAPQTETKTHGVPLAVSANSGSLDRAGFTFAGWNTAADGSGTVFAGGSLLSTDAPMVLYAYWLPGTLPVYAVTYNANGATGGTPPAAQEKVQGIALALSANSGNLARSGFVFSGWNTAADGSGTDYVPGASYTADAAVVLHAKWTAATVAGGFVSGQPLSFKVMSSTVVRRTGKVRKSELRVPAGMPRYRKGQAVTFRVGSAGQLVAGKLSLPLRKATPTKNYHLFKKTGRRSMTGRALVAKSPATPGALATAKGLRLTFVRKMGSSTVTVTYVLTRK